LNSLKFISQSRHQKIAQNPCKNGIFLKASMADFSSSPFYSVDYRSLTFVPHFACCSPPHSLHARAAESSQQSLCGGQPAIGHPMSGGECGRKKGKGLIGANLACWL